MAASMSPYNDSKDHYVWQMFLSLFNLNIGLLIPWSRSSEIPHLLSILRYQDQEQDLEFHDQNS